MPASTMDIIQDYEKQIKRLQFERDEAIGMVADLQLQNHALQDAHKESSQLHELLEKFQEVATTQNDITTVLIPTTYGWCINFRTEFGERAVPYENLKNALQWVIDEFGVNDER